MAALLHFCGKKVKNKRQKWITLRDKCRCMKKVNSHLSKMYASGYFKSSLSRRKMEVAKYEKRDCA